MTGERSPAGLAALESTYEIVRELGRGGTAVVYLARERATGHEVAIKLIRAKYIEDDEALGRFAREARFVAQLHHPNVIPVQSVLDLGDAGIGLVMAHMTGRTLDQFIRDEGRLSPERAEAILRDVAQALDAAHTMGIVHRDVKPGNIFIEPDGRALLADFGLARSMTGETQLTMTGVAIGTPTYMAPEQIDGIELDGRGDIYSLGLVAWEMLSGTRPWAGESLYAVLYHQKHEYLPDVRELRPDVPDRLAGIIARSIEKEPAARWQSIPELLAALDDATRVWPGPRVRPTNTDTVRFVRPAAGAVAAGAIDWTAVMDESLTPAEQELADDRARGGADPSGRAPAGGWGGVTRGTRGGFNRRRATYAAAAAGGIGALALLLSLLRARTPPEDMTHAALPEQRVAQGAPAIPDGSTGQPSLGGEVGPVVGADSLGRLGPRRTASAGGDSTRSVAVNVPPLPAPPGTSVSAAIGANSSSSGQSRGGTGTASLPGTPLARASATPAPSVAPPSNAAVASATDGTSAMPAELSVSDAIRRRAVSTSGASITAGGRHSCLVAADGRAYCWGSNDRGQLGGASGARSAAPALISSDLRFVTLSLGLSHSCGIVRGGAAWCWGENDHGQLGDRSSAARAAPTRVADVHAFSVLASGAAHSCALDTAGSAWCWGANSNGQLGDGTTTDRGAPVAVAGRNSFSSLAVGWNFACGLRSDGSALCWGDGNSGQLGDGSTSDRRTPVAVHSTSAFVSLSAGSAHACGVTVQGDAYCWGRNTNGQIGDGTTVDRSAPVRVQGAGKFTSIAAGAVHTCALDADGDAYCWGRNTYGQLGDGSTTDHTQLTRVAGGHRFASIRTFGSHSCAATSSGEAFCWGYNADGQLGDGTRVSRTRPVYVEPPGGT